MSTAAFPTVSQASGAAITGLFTQRGLVRLGKSGLKVSKIILGCMSYGDPEWMKWVLGEEEGIEQIKFACAFSDFNVEPRQKLRVSVTKMAFRLLTQLM